LSVDFGQGISNAWSSVVNIVPKLVAFAVIMLVGWFICRAIAKVLDRVLRKVGVERLAERAGMGRMLQNSAWDTTTIITKLVYYGLLLVTLQLAFGVFGPNPISDMIHSVVAWLPRGLVAVVIFVVTMAIANVVREIVTNTLSATSYGGALGMVAWAFVAFFGTVAALAQAGIATFVLGPLLWAVLLTMAGIAIVGLGGGLIQPMKGRWEKMLNKVEDEGRRVLPASAGGAAAYQKGRTDAMTGQPAPAADTEAGRQYGREGGTTS
jgi:hypothetical protein